LKISQNQTSGTYRIFIFSARLTTLDDAIAMGVLPVCPSVCDAANPFCIIR